ncbi:MAG: hypothetical protein K2H91_01025 [Lachnospiraceae bacterium]|nr:hypothetical protein [Lachnospiraceae bacterium]
MQRQTDTKDEKSIQWHNAFCAATELELADNADVLNFHREYILGKEPHRQKEAIAKPWLDGQKSDNKALGY